MIRYEALVQITKYEWFQMLINSNSLRGTYFEYFSQLNKSIQRYTIHAHSVAIQNVMQPEVAMVVGAATKCAFIHFYECENICVKKMLEQRRRRRTP